jgi:peptidoglycan/xylan/chitin deacetylase (PgdA/CDA1 family)
MNTKVTVIMYHYVREIANSRYPGIKGLETSSFKEQIFFLKKYYNFITMEQFIDSIDLNLPLPPKAVLLTFDDGYIDHFTQVFPILFEQNIQGSFYIPVKTVINHKLLDVNKIHFILSSCLNTKLLVEDILYSLDVNRVQFNLKSNEFYLNKLFISNRYDTSETVFVKRMLQVELCQPLRKLIVNDLFVKYVAISEEIFAKELYLSVEQIKTMIKCGMHIGAHGYDHYWLDSLDKRDQYTEVSNSLEFLLSVGICKNYWTICYPYGAYNDDTISILRNLDCKAAFTTEVKIADIKLNMRYAFPRLDTNDFPIDSLNQVNDWYKST